MAASVKINLDNAAEIVASKWNTKLGKQVEAISIFMACFYVVTFATFVYAANVLNQGDWVNEYFCQGDGPDRPKNMTAQICLGTPERLRLCDWTVSLGGGGRCTNKYPGMTLAVVGSSTSAIIIMLFSIVALFMNGDSHFGYHEFHDYVYQFKKATGFLVVAFTTWLAALCLIIARFDPSFLSVEQKDVNTFYWLVIRTLLFIALGLFLPGGYLVAHWLRIPL
jgi:hypothetical protein